MTLVARPIRLSERVSCGRSLDPCKRAVASSLDDLCMVARGGFAVVGVRCASLECDAPAACRDDEYVAVGDSLCSLVGGFEACVAEDGLEYDSGLGEGERGADTSSGSAAERYPGVGAGASVKETLGTEGERVRVELGSAVYERYVGDDHRATRDG